MYILLWQGWWIMWPLTLLWERQVCWVDWWKTSVARTWPLRWPHSTVSGKWRLQHAPWEHAPDDIMQLHNHQSMCSYIQCTLCEQLYIMYMYIIVYRGVCVGEGVWVHVPMTSCGLDEYWEVFHVMWVSLLGHVSVRWPMVGVIWGRSTWGNRCICTQTTWRLREREE